MCSSSFHPAPTILLYLELRARNSQQILGPIKKVCKGAGWRWGSPDSQFIWMTQGGERWVRWKSSHSSALKLRRQWTLFKVFLPTILIENCRECDGKGSANRFEPPAWYWRTISKGEGSFHRTQLFHFWSVFFFLLLLREFCASYKHLNHHNSLLTPFNFPPTVNLIKGCQMPGWCRRAFFCPGWI